MNKEAQEVLNNIVKKEPHELTEADKGFLRARRSYLSTEDMERFADVLSETDAETTDEPEGPTYQELVEEAKALGIKTHRKKAQELKELIAEAKAQN